MTPIDSLRIASRLAALNKSQWWSEARIGEYQNDSVVEALRHAIATVPYYRSLGLEATSIKSVDDLERFPILTKANIQHLRDELLSDEFRKADLRCSTTSGSSGEPTTTYFDKDCWLLSKFALKIRRMLCSGLGPFKRVVIVSEQAPDQLRRSPKVFGSRFLFDQRMLSIHDPVSSHIPSLLERRIDGLYAFPSYLAELLDHCEEKDVELPQISVVFTSSEVLRDSLRSRIEECFGCRVCDIYGSTEFKEIAWQCVEGTYHVNFESAYLETAPDDASDPGTAENILVTSLTNRAMPLIRFRIGDECRLSHIDCSCGRSGPSLEDLGGRIVDMVRLPNGERLSPYLLTTAIEDNPDIAKYQLVQAAGDDIELRYVPRGHDLPAEDVRAISSALRARLGESMAIRVTSVAEIPRSGAGKHRVFVQSMGS